MDSLLSSYGSPFLAAIAIGLSCGTGCSPLISLFLASFIMGNSGSVKKGLLSFFYFFTGKTSVVVVLAFLSAIFGSAVFNEDSSFLDFNLKLVFDIFLITTGVVLLLKILFYNKGTCEEVKYCGEKPFVSCGLCDSKGKTIRDKTGFAVFLAGVAYGVTPCAPLLMILILASMSKPTTSIPISILFSVSTAISPLIVLSAMAGFFSKKMHEEIPQFIKLFRIIAYVIFILSGIISLIFHLK